MNDALMIGVVLTLLFGALAFYLYNRLSMAERKLGLFEGVLTDLKVMMDAAPFASGAPPSYMGDFEPTPEYLNAISGPVPLQTEDVEDVAGGEEDYQQTIEQALDSMGADSKALYIDEANASASVISAPAISVTKLSPDLESMTVKELLGLAKQNGVSVPAGTRRKEIIELLKRAPSTQGTQGTMLDGPEPSGGSPLDGLAEDITI